MTRLTVSIIKGDDIKAGRSLFGKADPYVLISVGDKLQKTKVCSGGGSDPGLLLLSLLLSSILLLSILLLSTLLLSMLSLSILLLSILLLTSS